MTKRIAGLVIAAAAASAFILPAAPASAGECINMGTTPVECLLEALGSSVASPCVRYGTYTICLGPVSG